MSISLRDAWRSATEYLILEDFPLIVSAIYVAMFAAHDDACWACSAGRKKTCVTRQRLVGMTKEDSTVAVDLDGEPWPTHASGLLKPVLMSIVMDHEIECHLRCGCGRIVGVGQCAYQWRQLDVSAQATAPLYATKECAQRASGG